jgi:hypothetical protein
VSESSTLLDDHWPPWSWDDEDKSVDPYIHIYSDGGAVVCLYYRSEEERRDYIRFAIFVCGLVNENE